MGKKRDNTKKDQQGKKKVLTLAELYDETPGPAPTVETLPTAPKAPEDWEREGGRPEYNTRGYKERGPRTDRAGYDDDFDDRDWTRKGPLDDDGPSFGNPGADRDWGDMRRGPVDGGDDGGAPRDWDAMRRGPVEPAFEGRPSGDMDWASRKGPVDAEGAAGAAPVSDDAWASARKGPIDSEFTAASTERDWSTRKPVESSAAEPARAEADWGAARKGPVESEFKKEEGAAEPDWSSRKPIDAEPAAAPRARTDNDWAAARAGATGVEAAAPEENNATVEETEKDSSDAPPAAPLDWSVRRGPVAARDEAQKPAARAVNFGDMRRGARMHELADTEAAGSETSTVGGERGRGRWRRGRGGRPASTGHEAGAASASGAGRERDWRSARVRSHPANNAAVQEGSGDTDDVNAGTETGTGTVAPAEGTERGGDWAGVRGREKPVTASLGDDEWTTVRATGSRRGGATDGFARRGAAAGPVRGARRGGFRGMERATEGGRAGAMRAALDGGKAAHSSPVTPITPAASKS